MKGKAKARMEKLISQVEQDVEGHPAMQENLRYEGMESFILGCIIGALIKRGHTAEEIADHILVLARFLNEEYGDASRDDLPNS